MDDLVRSNIAALPSLSLAGAKATCRQLFVICRGTQGGHFGLDPL